jgi:hypothetical protein
VKWWVLWFVFSKYLSLLFKRKKKFKMSNEKMNNMLNLLLYFCWWIMNFYFWYCTHIHTPRDFKHRRSLKIRLKTIEKGSYLTNILCFLRTFSYHCKTNGVFLKPKMYCVFLLSNLEFDSDWRNFYDLYYYFFFFSIILIIPHNYYLI